MWAQAKVSIKTLTEAGRVHTRHKVVLEGSKRIPAYQSSASLAQNFVKIEGDSPGEEATETSNQFKESKKMLHLEDI